MFISTTDSVEFLHTLFSGISFYNSENENDDQKPAQKKNLFQNKSKYNIKNNNKNNKNKNNNNNNNNEEDNNNNENEMEEEDDENEEKREELPLCFVKVYKLHGNMTQRDRTETFLAFKKAEAGILLCTDVGLFFSFLSSSLSSFFIYFLFIYFYYFDISILHIWYYFSLFIFILFY